MTTRASERVSENFMRVKKVKWKRNPKKKKQEKKRSRSFFFPRFTDRTKELILFSISRFYLSSLFFSFFELTVGIKRLSRQLHRAQKCAKRSRGGIGIPSSREKTMVDAPPPSASGVASTSTSTITSPPPPPPPPINNLTSQDHLIHMRRAIALSRAAGLDQRTGGCFGAVVVDSQTRKVLGEGQNRVLETKDPTAHGEVVCLRDACAKLDSPHLPKGTAVLYTSAEPCPMCHAACLWARCSFVFFAASHEDVMEWGRFEDVDFASEVARRVMEKRVKERGKEEEKRGVMRRLLARVTTKAKPPPPLPPPLLEIAPPLLREEALVVWKEYAALSDSVHY